MMILEVGKDVHTRTSQPLHSTRESDKPTVTDNTPYLHTRHMTSHTVDELSRSNNFNASKPFRAQRSLSVTIQFLLRESS